MNACVACIYDGTMVTLKVHAAGDWAPGEVRTGWTESTHALSDAVREAIERSWRNAIGRPGIKLFDGPMCRLESWAVSGSRLQLAMSKTSYKAFWGTNLQNPHLADRFGARALANPVGVSPALETADGFLLMGRRNASVAYYPNRTHPFAGCLEPGDVTSAGGPDLFAGVLRELAEELSLDADEVPLVRCTGIVEDTALRQPELIFRVRSTLTHDEIEARLAPEEHRASLAIPAREETVSTAVCDPALTPVGVASLLLWGRVSFGQDWFEAQRI